MIGVNKDMRKIDDDILHKMIEEGKSQREMARSFGVSDAAISKRIKRLTKAEPPESFKSLAAKEQKFVLAKLEGKSGTAAALQAFDCGSVESAKTIGSRLSGDPDIKRAIHDLMHEEGIGRRRRVQRLRDLIEAKDLGIAAKGLDIANRMTGDYAPEKIDMVGQIASVHALIAEIRQYDAEQKLTTPEDSEI